jgi:nascent polypeptide-associated complex subunit alpha
MSTSKIEELLGASSARIEEIESGSDAESISSASETEATTPARPGYAPRALNRNEKKARKALLKLGLKPMTNVYRVTLRKGKNNIFVIANAEVYKSPLDNAYIIFGVPTVENNSLANALAGMQQPQSVGQKTEDDIPEASKLTIEEEEESKEEADDEPLPEGLDEKDVKIVIDQAKVSRAEAIANLKKHNFDIVNTIMELTM